MSSRNPISYIIGIDEVGRGPLAGPVVVCAVAVPRGLRPASIAKHIPLLPSSLRQAQDNASSGSCTKPLTRGLVLRDSKKLSALQRGAWATAIKADSRIRHAVAAVTPRVIDRINVTQAANRAATRALEKLLATLPVSTRIDVFLDGGLFVKHNFKFEILNPKNNTKHKYSARFYNTAIDTYANLNISTIIKGDETIPAISLASIVAKEHRDALMRRAHKKYPLYGFDRHAGYGTKRHIAAIKKNGRTPLHRNSFLKKIA